MDVPTTKSALLWAMETGRSEWETLLFQIDEQALLEPGVEGVWSVKEIVAHIAGYEEYAAALLTDRLETGAGAQAALDAFYQQQLNAYRHNHPDFPAQLNDADDDQTNALVVAVYNPYSAHAVLDHEHQTYLRLLAATRAVSDAKLTEP